MPFSIKSKYSMKRLLLAFIIILLCALSPLAAQSQGETLQFLMDPGKDAIVLNPYTASDSNSIIIMLNLYEGLFGYDSATSEPDLALAESYSVSEDGLKWTFTLREASFSDGKAITSRTFEDSWNYMLGGPLASNLDFVKRRADGKLDLETPDNRTLIVNLKYAVPYLPSLLCQPCLAAIKDMGSYSGAYTLLSQSDEKIRLRRNPYYWDEVKTDFVEITLGEGYDQAFLNGQIQWSMAPITDAADYMVLSELYATTFFYFSAKEGAYADENIRKALIKAIPSWDIIRGIQQSLKESTSLVPNSNLEVEIDDDILDLLEEGGYPYGEKALPMINMAVTRGSQNALAAEMIAWMWSNWLGITVTLNTVPLSVFAADPAENPYDFCTITWIGDYFDPMAFLQLFASDSSYNLANFSDSRYDDLLNLAMNTDEISRRELLLQAEQLLLDSGVVIPMSTAFATNFVRKDLISGWETNPLDIHPFKTISFNH